MGCRRYENRYEPGWDWKKCDGNSAKSRIRIRTGKKAGKSERRVECRSFEVVAEMAVMCEMMGVTGVVFDRRQRPDGWCGG
jgi:hypothetical protein